MRRFVLAAAVLVTLARSTFSLADYKETYKKGLDAIGRKNWLEAARLMRLAAAEQSREGEQVKLYGMRFETYMPHYYLGLALFQSGDCPGAVGAWTVSQRQGALKGAEAKAIVQNLKACEVRMAGEARKPGPPTLPPAPAPAGPTLSAAQVAQAAQAAEGEIARADEAARAVAGLQSDPLLGPVWAQDASLGGNQRQAQDLLSAAKARLDAGRRGSDLAALGEARDIAARAAQVLEGIRREASERRDELARRAAEARPADAKPMGVAPRPAGPPADLLSGAQAYFNARYREAVETLGRANVPAGPAAAHTALLRAAARYALYLIGGEKDEPLRRAAAEDVRACRKQDAGVKPDPQIFSPRFVDFFKKI